MTQESQRMMTVLAMVLSVILMATSLFLMQGAEDIALKQAHLGFMAFVLLMQFASLFYIYKKLPR